MDDSLVSSKKISPFQRASEGACSSTTRPKEIAKILALGTTLAATAAGAFSYLPWGYGVIFVVGTLSTLASFSYLKRKSKKAKASALASDEKRQTYANSLRFGASCSAVAFVFLGSLSTLLCDEPLERDRKVAAAVRAQLSKKEFASLHKIPMNKPLRIPWTATMLPDPKGAAFVITEIVQKLEKEGDDSAFCRKSVTITGTYKFFLPPDHAVLERPGIKEGCASVTFKSGPFPFPE